MTAIETHRVWPDVALVRSDGWTIACKFEDELAVRKLWDGDWVERIDLHTGAHATMPETSVAQETEVSGS